MLTVICMCLLSVCSQLLAQTAAQVYLTRTNVPSSGFITNSSASAIKFRESLTSPEKIIPFTDIKGEGLRKGIVLEDRVEVLAPGRLAFAKGDFRTAAGEFRKVAEKYAYLLNLPQNFASEAKFYEIECYRRAGAFKAIKPALESRAGQTIDTKLSDYYKTLSKLHKLWAIFGANDMASLEQELAVYQVPVTGNAKLLPAPSFKKMPHGQLAQIAFMRAKLYESKGEKQKALQDYYRVLTNGQGYDEYLTKQAMGASMVIQAEDPRLKSDQDKVKESSTRQMQSIAYFFNKRFPDTTIPLQFQDYAVRPKIDIVLATKKEEAPMKKEEPMPEAKKPEAKKPAPKAKGKPKKKPAPKKPAGK